MHMVIRASRLEEHVSQHGTVGVTNLKIVGRFDVKTFSRFMATSWPHVEVLTLYRVKLTADRFIDLASMCWPKLKKLDVEGNNFYVPAHRETPVVSFLKSRLRLAFPAIETIRIDRGSFDLLELHGANVSCGLFLALWAPWFRSAKRPQPSDTTGVAFENLAEDVRSLRRYQRNLPILCSMLQSVYPG